MLVFYKLHHMNPLSSITSAFYNERPATIELKNCYQIIPNLFPEQDFQTIPEWCKNLKPIAYNGTDVLFSLFYISTEFTAANRLANPSSFFLRTGSSETMQKFITVAVERFAKELNLTGVHKINVDFHRELSEKSDTIQRWHYDNFAEKSQISVLQNGFKYYKEIEKGLDIGENNSDGPFDPVFLNNDDSESHYPKSGYISVPYPSNGAILLDHRKGKILHRRSPYLRSMESTASRTVLQIKLKAPASDWSTENTYDI